MMGLTVLSKRGIKTIVANPSFEMLQFRGLIVDPSEKKMLADAKKKFKEKGSFYICGVWSF